MGTASTIPGLRAAAVAEFAGTGTTWSVWTPAQLEKQLWWWRDLSRWLLSGFQEEEVYLRHFSAWMQLALKTRASRQDLLKRWRERELISRFAPKDRYIPAFWHPRLERDAELELRLGKARFAARGRLDLGELKRAGEQAGMISLDGVRIDVRYPGAAHEQLESIMRAHRKKHGLSIKSSHMAKHGAERWLSMFKCVEEIDLKTLSKRHFDHDYLAIARRHRARLKGAVQEELLMKE